MCEVCVVWLSGERDSNCWYGGACSGRIVELASLGFRSDDGVTLGVPLGSGLYELHSFFTLMV